MFGLGWVGFVQFDLNQLTDWIRVVQFGLAVFGLGWVRVSWVFLCKEAVSKVWFVLLPLVVECINLFPGHRNRRKIRIRKKKKIVCLFNQLVPQIWR
jgi:hypothetical protein